jgi:hypothetical protein
MYVIPPNIPRQHAFYIFFTIQITPSYSSWNLYKCTISTIKKYNESRLFSFMNEWELKFLVGQFWYLRDRWNLIQIYRKFLTLCLCFMLHVFTINSIPVTCLALVDNKSSPTKCICRQFCNIVITYYFCLHVALLGCHQGGCNTKGKMSQH